MSHQESELEDLSARTITKQTSNPPPDGGYGWVCVVCTFLINAHTWGINSVSIPSHCLSLFSTKTQKSLCC